MRLEAPVDAGREDGVIEQLMSSALLNGDGRYVASFTVNVENVNTAAGLSLSPSLDGIRRTILRGEVTSDELALIKLDWTPRECTLSTARRR